MLRKILLSCAILVAKIPMKYQVILKMKNISTNSYIIFFNDIELSRA